MRNAENGMPTIKRSSYHKGKTPNNPRNRPPLKAGGPRAASKQIRPWRRPPHRRNRSRRPPLRLPCAEALGPPRSKQPVVRSADSIFKIGSGPSLVNENEGVMTFRLQTDQEDPRDSSSSLRTAGDQLRLMLQRTAEAQPTPARTEIAPKAQLRAQAPHSMHRSRPVTAAVRPYISKTPWGQTAAHKPQPAHLRGSYFRVVTFFK